MAPRGTGDLPPAPFGPPDGGPAHARTDEFEISQRAGFLRQTAQAYLDEAGK